MMNGPGKSDRPIVPMKSPNKAGRPAAEAMEGRGRPTGNPSSQTMHRTQGRERMQRAWKRVREAGRKDRKTRLTSLFHHITSVDALRDAYCRLNRQAAPGVDGVRWKQYGAELEANLQDLSARLKRGGYRAKPVRRTYIPKADGRQRPLGVTALEDKLVQTSAVETLNAVYENDFLGFSYGFRPGRGQHDALDALAVGIEKKRIAWVLDADIRGFFDAIDHGWMVKFVEHRIGDQRVVRLIRKWLSAGVLEDGTLRQVEEGTPQGGSISPLLSNIYLHYVLDLWTDRWRKAHAAGEVIIVRYADDFIIGFQSKSDAERFLGELRERLAKFSLELHPEKTRLIEFGTYAAERRMRRGLGKPETFDFLGFTHICGKAKNGWFQLWRKTRRKRLQTKLHEIKIELRRRWHEPIKQVGRWLGSVVAGHFRYYGVPYNLRALWSFRAQVTRLWRRALERRSQRAAVSWARVARLRERFLPPALVCHPYPDQRFRARTQGRSPVR
jgi:RNA-directed DNA polymerase